MRENFENELKLKNDKINELEIKNKNIEVIYFCLFLLE